MMKPKRTVNHDRKVLIYTLLSGLPAIILVMIFLWGGDHSSKTQWTLTALIVALWLGFAMSAQQHVIRPLQTLSNLLAALREGDYSMRAVRPDLEDALGEVMFEVNALADTLKEQRLGALEATALLRAVMEEIEVAVFAFDETNRLRLANRAGERLLAH